MLRALLLLFVFASPALADDPLCANMHGVERFNPVASYPLGVITKCSSLYCDSTVSDQNVKNNLKVIDSKLTDLSTFTAQTNASFQKFKRACKALNGDLTQVGPKMDAFRTATFELGINKSKLSGAYDALQKPPLEDTFSNTSASVARDYHKPDCMNQINKTTIDGLNKAQDLLDTAQVDCAP